MKYPKVITKYRVEPIEGKTSFRVVRYKILKHSLSAKEQLLKKSTLFNDVDKDFADNYVFIKERTNK